MLGKKTGGRIKGISKNKPKVPTLVPTDVAAGVATAGGGGAAGEPNSFAPQARAHAREANGAALPRGLKVRYRLLDDVREYENNANVHPPAQIKLIERLLVKNGWMGPMGEARDVLVYGHARWRAARNLRDRGVAIRGNPDPDRGPFADLSHLSEAEQRAYRLADNESARKATTDFDLLRFELGELRLDNFDLSFTGYDDNQLLNLLGDEEPDLNEPIPEPLAAKPVVCPKCGHSFPP